MPYRPLVLVIEDDSRLASAAAMLIEDWGYECVVVETSTGVGGALGERVGELVAVVADLSMQEMSTQDSGTASAAMIRATVGQHVPLIATSSYPALAARNGFSEVLAKPYDPEELRRWLAARSAPDPHRRVAC